MVPFRKVSVPVAVAGVTLAVRVRGVPAFRLAGRGARVTELESTLTATVAIALREEAWTASPL